MLKGKHILLGVTGSIAAYKAATLIRLLVKEGAEVKVIMTEMAKQFITPLTMATLSKNPILVEFYNPENGDWNSHVSLGIWTDLYLIAPASANTIAKMCYGVADNLLLTTYLSCRAPVAIAPAMDFDMYKHITTQQNIQTLRSRGVSVIEPVTGELASGLEGKGRMEEPENILESVISVFKEDKNFKKKRVLITAGPTRERLDPVRYISNFSTGKMGYAIANEFAMRGADVDLISGPVDSIHLNPSITLKSVESAEDMYRQVLKNREESRYDVVVLCAAVADYTPVEVKQSKVKREKENFSIEFKATKDIAAEIGILPDAIKVGFALESDDELKNAKGKLERKGLDMIVLNSLKDEGAGFGTDTNKVTILFKDGRSEEFGLKSKKEVAKDIVDIIAGFSKC